MAERPDRSRLRVVLNGGAEGGERPGSLAVYLIGRDGGLIRRVDIDAKGEAAVTASELEKAAEVLVGAPVEHPRDLGSDATLRLYASDIADLVREGVPLEIDETDWRRFISVRACVDGKVTACRYRYWLYEQLVLEASPLKIAASQSKLAAIDEVADVGIRARRGVGRVAATLATSDLLPHFPFPICSDVCHGLIDVYRRTCCCPVIVIHDPRLDDLRRRLEEILKQRPPIKWPPPPPPPPPFFDVEAGPIADPTIDQVPLDVLVGGDLNMAMIMAERDLNALETLDAAAIPAYVAEREYLRPLWCSCGVGQKVAQGTIRPDGTFRICWREPVRIFQLGCWDEYAFVVRQNINGVTTVIYDGIAAGQWFRSPTGIHLTTYDRRAVRCDDPLTPDDGTAFVLLERIGGASAYRLKTPDQDTWDGVLPPAYNDGLLDPAPTAADARGNSRNSNWGGTLALTYKFSDAMRDRGAVYYRVSVIASDANGNPTGGRTPLNGGVAWYWYDYSIPNQIGIQSESLGPVPPVNGQNNLYRIPYRADRDWQFSAHAYLDTTAFGNDRYLVMLEVLDGAGNVLKPTGTDGPGNDTAFDYRRWFQQIGPTAVVPHGALTHMFWWDNRAAIADIVDLRQDGLTSTDECQFKVGTPTSQFSVGYRAYHPNPMFIFKHTMTWHRGLGGSSGVLISSPDNAGVGPLAVTPPVPFGTLLGSPLPNHRCSFSLDLDVSVKTTNGSGPLYGLYGHEQAAFALED